jgi:hypothetical protein
MKYVDNTRNNLRIDEILSKINEIYEILKENNLKVHEIL